MKKLLFAFLILSSVFLMKCSKEDEFVVTSETLSGTDWKSANVGTTLNPEYLMFKFTSSSTLELWSKRSNDGVFSRIIGGDYSLSENKILIDFGTGKVSGYTKGESLKFVDSDIWQSIGPDSIVFRIAIDGNAIYSLTNHNFVNLSTNGGTDFKVINSGLNTTMKSVRSIAVHNGNVYIGTVQNGIYLTTDIGLNWKKVSDTPSDFFEVIDNKVISAASGYGVQLTTDNGVTWKAGTPNLINKNFWAFASGENKLYAGTTDGGVFVSSDYGNTWNSIGLFNRGIMALACEGINIFAGTQGSGIYLSSTNANTWKQLSGMPILFVNALAKKSNILVAAGGSEVCFSIDNGNNWKTVYGTSGGCAINDLKVTDTYIYAGTGCGIMRIPVALLSLPNSTFTVSR
jgi:photosystem II stability/assembly factor-like uncharacterized protein